MRIILVFFTLLFFEFATAQKAVITGVITDLSYPSETLPGVSVTVKGTQQGTQSDVNGNYTLELLPGDYTLVYSFIGYDTLEAKIKVKGGERIVMSQALNPNSISIEEVVINIVQNREKVSALLKDRQQSIEIKQNIGAQELGVKGISDVASAVAKTSGVSKQEGSGNVYVRGLGDRYNSTTMNGLPIPSNDPKKKNIALDLFSTDIVEYIAIDKVYGVKNFGDFAGGNVDISSKNYQGNGMLEIAIGSKVNTNAVEKKSEFYLQDGPNYRGFSSYNIPQNPIQQYGFNNSLNPVKHAPYAGSFSFKTGKSFDVGKEGKLSVFATGSFDNGFEFREGINQSVSAQGARLKSLHQQKSSYTTNTTGMLNVNHRLNPNHRVYYNLLFVNSSDQSRDTYNGFLRDIAEDDNGLVQRATYVQNSILINQLLGSHSLTEKLNIDWGMSYNTIQSDMPDRTQNTLKKLDSGYVLSQNTITDNHRYYQKLTEDEFAANILVSTKLFPNEDNNYKGKVTLGYGGRFKHRDFEALQFNFRITGSQLNTVVDPNKLDLFFNPVNFENQYFKIETFTGSVVTPQTYNGEQNIHAGLAQLEYQFSDKLSGIFGVRYEMVEQTIEWRTQLSSTQSRNTFERKEWLPSLVLKYELNENQNLRLGASKTYTLPQFKERALFIYEDVTESEFGNPYLYPSQNYNLDLKWEMFPQSEELIAFTFFGKMIKDPINEVTVASSTNDISWVNIGDRGYVYGMEAELRKKIFNLDGEYKNQLLGGVNLSYMKTHQDIDSQKVQRETQGRLNINITDTSSSFTGASDLLLTADASYFKEWKNHRSMTATLSYTYYSDRLYALGVESKGNLVDKGMGTLDFILKTKLNRQLSLDFTAKNILNPEFRRVQQNPADDVPAVSYKRGAYFGLGLSYSL